MSNYKRDIESIYKDAFENYSIKASPKVWDNIEKELNKTSFFKFSPRKINIYYVGLTILLCLGAFFIVAQKIDNNVNPSTKSFAENLNKNEETDRNYINIIDSNIIINENIVSEENKNIPTNSNPETYEQHENNQNILEEKTNLSKKVITGISVKNQVISKIDISSERKLTNSKSTGFELSECEGCAPLKVEFNCKIPNPDYFTWYFGDGATSTALNNEHTYINSGSYIVCFEYTISDKTEKIYDTIIVNQTPEAKFDIDYTEELLTETNIEFINYSQNAISYKWNFGDNQLSDSYEPNHSYSDVGNYFVKLFAYNSYNCMDSSLLNINIKEEKYKIVFPTAFYPSNSGSNGGYYNTSKPQNDIFYPVIAYEVEEYDLIIYNRKGIVIFSTSDINIGWDGYFENELVDAGVYVYIAKGKYSNGESFYLTGNVTLLLRK